MSNACVITSPPSSDSPATPGNGLIVAAGLVALAVAMGIGRFAFTPLLPLMLRDGTLAPDSGAEWAAANYGGYLLGALTAGRFAADPRHGLRLGLAGVVLATLAVAALGGVTWFAAAGTALRAVAGVFSAWTLVCVSSWCLALLSQRGAGALGAWIYTGVGLGIAAAGLLAWLGGSQSAQALWLELGLVAAAGAAFVGLRLRAGGGPQAPAAKAAMAAPVSAEPAPGQWPMVLCYGTFGFGYIIPATFLPAMAREQVADPLVFGLTWPLFGLAAAASVAAAARWLGAWPRRRVWALAQGVMALGTALPLAAQSLGTLALSAVLVGGTFMVATMAGLQLAREQAAGQATALLARMTVAFAAGQIAGPLLVRLIGAGRFAGLDALGWSHALATALLAATAAWLWRVPSSHVSFAKSSP